MWRAATPTSGRKGQYPWDYAENIAAKLAVRLRDLAHAAHQHLDTADRHLQRSSARNTRSHPRTQPQTLRLRKAQTDPLRGPRLRRKEGEPRSSQGEIDRQGR